MPFTVLRISQSADSQTEVLGEFWDEEGARRFAETAQLNEPNDELEYCVEAPPSSVQPTD